jgi:hypothetical protein
MLRKLLLGGFSSLCFLGFASLATAAEPPRAKTAAAYDLRPIMKNKVHTVAKKGTMPGYTLYAVVANGRVKAFEAVTAEGRRLPMEQKGNTVQCFACVFVTDKNGNTSQSCYQIDCDKMPPGGTKNAGMINSSCGCASRT